MINLSSLGVKGIKQRNLEIEYVPLLSLQPNSYNPNLHNIQSFNLLIKSICLFGFTQPIVVRKGTNEIIDGEHRWRAASILDIEKIPVTFIELTDEEMRLATIMHNKARGKEDAELINKIDLFLKNKSINMDNELLKKQIDEV
jgi:ParB family chromosome partitioning protein